MPNRKRRNSSSPPSSPSSHVSASASSSPSSKRRRRCFDSPSPRPPALVITDSDLEFEVDSGLDDGEDQLDYDDCGKAGKRNDGGYGGGGGGGKRRRGKDDREVPRVHPLYGQRMAFPGLGPDDGDDDDVNFEEEEEKKEEECGNGEEGEGELGKLRIAKMARIRNGVGYLKMVRSEAKKVPHILVGPGEGSRNTMDHSLEEEKKENAGGYFDDGAFIAAPDSGSKQAHDTKHGTSTPDAQEAYYAALRAQFQTLKDMLHQAPDVSAIETLTTTHPVSLAPHSSTAKQQWRFLLRTQQPLMVQLACMDMETILEIVKLLKISMAAIVRSSSQERAQRLGAWIWGILGRCDEVGQLGSDEVSELRELGKRAVGLLVGIRDRTGRAYGYEAEPEENGEESTEVVEETSQAIDKGASDVRPKSDADRTDESEMGLQAASGLHVSETGPPKTVVENDVDRPGSKDGDYAEEGQITADGKDGKDGRDGNTGDEVAMSTDQQIRVMLDTIITVVGDCYGQRDLLEFRDIWDDEGQLPATA